MRDILFTELLKLRRAAVVWGTLGAMLASPLGVALLIWIVQDPERAARTGMLGTKADLTGVEATWASYGSFVVLIIGSAGWLVLAFIMSFVFGREYSDRTATALFTFPVPRYRFAVAKFLLSLGWWAIVTVLTLAEAVVVGLALGLSGWTPQLPFDLLADAGIAAAVTWLAGPPVALLAVWSRGYLAPVGAAMALLLAGQLLGQTGWASWFPWSVLVSANTDPVGVPAHSWVPLLATAVLGIAATVWRYRTADVQ